MASPATQSFGPRFIYDGGEPDMKATSADAVDFNVHSRALLAASSNAFGEHISGGPPHPPITLLEAGATLDIVFSAIYGLSCIEHEPSLETTEAAIDALIKYGVSIPPRATPSSPLGELLLSYAPHRSIEVFALAAHHGLEELVTPLSAPLLSYNFIELPDELAVKMGPMYLGRLFTLQQGRLAALRRIAVRMPAGHAPTATCEGAQRQVDRAWAFAMAGMAWNMDPGMSTDTLAAAFEPARTSVTCADCRAAIGTRIEEMTAEWSTVKGTI